MVVPQDTGEPNLFWLTARVLTLESQRYTPAGLAALNLTLGHESRIDEEGVMRSVRLEIRALALGELALKLSRTPVGQEKRFCGFLQTARGAKNPVFHLQSMFDSK